MNPIDWGTRYADETIAPLEALVAVLVRNPAVIAFVEIKDESIAHCGREAMLQRSKQFSNQLRNKR